MTTVTETLLAGAWRTSTQSIPVHDPADIATEIGRVPALTADDVGRAAAAAHSAQGAWEDRGHVQRGRVLAAAARLIRDDVEALTRLVVREAGKLEHEARGEVLKAADFFEYYSGLGRVAIGDVLPDERPATFSLGLRRPVGVVVAITPWNDPLLTPARKLGPALVSGNAVLLKPATATPLIAVALARVLEEAGLPAGVLSVVTGRGEAISSALLSAPEVAAVTFTGSTATGGTIRRDLSARNVRLQTEMGGKNAAVVLPDADLDQAVRTILSAAFAQAGQRCTATSRVIAHTDVWDEVRDRLQVAATSLETGPPSDPEARMGPVIDERHLASIDAHVRRAIDEDGAELLTGGRRLVDPPLDRGCFYAPTLLAVEAGARIWKDEVFGPVLVASRARDVEEAIDLVNDSEYGLSATVFTNDLGATLRFVSRVETGQIAVNHPTSGWGVQLPFGGFKDSGSGYKEQGTAALDFYTRWQTLALGWRP